MKLLLSNLFSVMAASSFVSSANALSLADYAAMTIGPATDDLATACKIGVTGNGVVTAADQLLSCGVTYSGTSLVGSSIAAKITLGTCADTADAAIPLTGDADATVVPGADATTTVTDTIDMVFTAAEKDGLEGAESTDVVQTYCARADVWDGTEANQASGSVRAYMMTVTTTTTFDNKGDFSTTVSTTEFDAKAAAAAATRTIPVFAKVGACTNGATSAALKELVQGNAIAIGAVLDICVFVDYDVDSDVQIAKVKSVVIKDGETTITTPVDENGAPDFVTTAEEDANAVKISTLMIPKIYDTLTLTEGAGSFTISGVAELTYIAGTRHLSSGERRLQSEEAPFSLEVDLTKNDLPQVAMNEEESGAMSAGVGMMALAAGVAALL